MGIRMKKKINCFTIYVILSALICIGSVLGVFLFVFIKGFKQITLDFILTLPKGIPLGSEGGILPAIIGSLQSGVITILISSIFGICTSIYLTFFCTSKKMYQYILALMQSLASIPSVVIGMFGYTFFVVILGFGRNLISASLTLSIMILPYITVKFKKAFEETSKIEYIVAMSLGVSKSYYILYRAIPSALTSILTSIGLVFVFAIGATAPIMFTGAVIYADIPKKLTDPFMALPYHLYMLVSEGISLDNAFATSCILVILVLLVNLLCHIIGFVKERYNA